LYADPGVNGGGFSLDGKRLKALSLDGAFLLWYDSRMTFPQMPTSSRKHYENENLGYLPEYTLRNMADGMPMWMVDIERADFRTGMDTGANPNALMIWNRVRKAHGFEPLTIDDLWKRHQDDQNWTDEYLDYERKGMALYRSTGKFPEEEFNGKMFRD
jgi:hypothetical protein